MTDALSSPRRRAALGCAALTLLLPAMLSPAWAQSTGRLYDPEPPVNSAYVRVVVADPGTPVDVLVDDKPRLRKVARFDASDYLVIPEGAHVIALTAARQDRVLARHALEVVRGKSLTLAFGALSAQTVPVVFEDKGNTNRLKAQITAYNLTSRPAVALNVTTADGAARVFSGLASGASASLQVNPISVELQAAEEKGKPVKFHLEMSAGATYSLLLFRDAQQHLQVRTLANRTERFVGP